MTRLKDDDPRHGTLSAYTFGLCECDRCRRGAPTIPIVWVLEPDWSKPPLSLNDRGHWAPKAAKTDQIRSWARDAATEALIPPLSHCVVQMVWTVPDKRRRDEENPVATLKPICDGIVDAGVVPDDVPAWMTKFMPRIEYVKGVSGVRFEISGVPS